jgi:energy-coupling factor transporter ATP-binding protein EcfA2
MPRSAPLSPSPPDPALSAPLSPVVPVAEVLAEDDIRFARAGRAYRVRGLARNLSAEALKVTLRVSAGDRLYLDTLDLYQSRGRHGFAKGAAVELGVAEDVIAGDLSALVLALEPLQEAAIRGALAPERAAAPVLSPADEAAGLALLSDPELALRIVRDVEAIGVVGEGDNALVAYLAMVSRLLERPLAVLIQSTSAAGKSTLMDALLGLMPVSQRVHYSAMTGQSLFYLGEGDLKHKILAIAEEEGVRQAAYALKLLQSQGELTIASTGKDPATGRLVTAEYRVEGPVMLCLTTTAIDIDEELLNRCLVLTIDETAAQTAAIQQRQRQARTLAGLQAKVRGDAVVAAHRAAQTLLRPLAVVNPYAEGLSFASDRVRLRRDHVKYLALIDAIALLHQQQRPIKRLSGDVEYIEVTPGDIALANRLAHAVLGRSLDELPPQTRRVLTALDGWVATQAQAQAMTRGALEFTRRQVRNVLGLSDTQLRVHLDRLVTLDYVLQHGGRPGQRMSYSLLFDGDAASDAPQLMGLSEAGVRAGAPTSRGEIQTSRGQSATSRGEDGHLAGASRPVRGGVAGRLRGGKTPLRPSADAAFSGSVPVPAPNAHHGNGVAR